MFSALMYMQHLQLEKGWIIYRKDQHPNNIYLITEGAIFFENDYKQSIKTMVKNSYFGEIEVIKNLNFNTLNKDKDYS